MVFIRNVQVHGILLVLPPVPEGDEGVEEFGQEA
jgi:hypothetical protein